MRQTRHYSPKNATQFQEQLLVWAQQFKQIVWLDTNKHKNKYSSYHAALAVDAYTELSTDFRDAFKNLDKYYSETNDWIFGYISYDLKNAIENLKSQNFDGLEFPELYVFQPKKLFLFKDDNIEIQYLEIEDNDIDKDIASINSTIINDELKQTGAKHSVKIKLRIQKDDYLKKVRTLLNHIHRGNIYEANFCQEFYALNTNIQPLETYKKLNKVSQTPFAAFLKLDDKYVLSASPERYITKQANKVISQPIKGTARRSHITKEDKQLAKDLALNEKERSENIMIVDLVRNDLSHTAKKGSVKVEELCEVYSFLQVHQMISAISAEVDEDASPIEILKTTFPMGSMTGAPKISAMQIIEDLEETKRGLYSGSVGYIAPNGDFDFNVVIRSILYNASKNYVSYSVGSAITAKSDPLKEYEECLIKAKAMREALEH